MRAILRIRKEPHYRRQAFEQGLSRVGFTLHESFRPESPSDWLVLWNRKKGTDEAEADAWEARGGTVIVCENGYLAKTEKTHYAISVHGHNGSGWHPVGDEDRFVKLGFEIKPWRRDGKEIIVRAQRGIGSTLMANPTGWAERITTKLRPLTRLPIRVVQHPGDKNKAASDAIALKNAAGIVIWSSALGVRALVEGVIVWCAAPHWVCGGCASPLTDFPVHLWQPDVARTTALHKMAHNQWHFDEIATGEPFARIIQNRSKAVWP